MLAFAQGLRGRDAGLQELNPGGGGVDTSIPMGSMVFTVMAALAPMELEFERDRITDSQIRNALWLIEAGESATQVARDLGMSRAIFYRRIREWAMSAGRTRSALRDVLMPRHGLSGVAHADSTQPVPYGKGGCH